MSGGIELLRLLRVSLTSSRAEDQLAALRQNFPNPAMDFRPHPHWGWVGNALSTEDIPPTWDVLYFIEAETLAARLSRVVEGCCALVRGFTTGNAFTNANKVLDHLMAHGEAGVRRAPPLLYSGTRLPAAFLESAATLLRQHGLMPPRGYWE